MTNPDPIIAALAAEQTKIVPLGKSKIDVYFADRPELLEAIRVARRDKRLSYAQIAAIIQQFEPDKYVAATTIGAWLRKQGIK